MDVKMEKGREKKKVAVNTNDHLPLRTTYSLKKKKNPSGVLI